MRRVRRGVSCLITSRLSNRRGNGLVSTVSGRKELVEVNERLAVEEAWKDLRTWRGGLESSLLDQAGIDGIKDLVLYFHTKPCLFQQAQTQNGNQFRW